MYRYKKKKRIGGKNGAEFHSVCPITVTTGTVYFEIAAHSAGYHGIFNSQLWGELPQFGYAKGLAADDPFSLGIPSLSEYSPHHCFCSLLCQDIVWQIMGKKSRGVLELKGDL